MPATAAHLGRRQLSAMTTGDLRRLAADPTIDRIARAMANGIVADRTRHLPR